MRQSNESLTVRIEKHFDYVGTVQSSVNCIIIRNHLKPTMYRENWPVIGPVTGSLPSILLSGITVLIVAQERRNKDPFIFIANMRTEEKCAVASFFRLNV